jgi:hypothetical protein
LGFFSNAGNEIGRRGGVERGRRRRMPEEARQADRFDGGIRTPASPLLASEARVATMRWRCRASLECKFSA